MQEGPVLKNRVKELRARLEMRQADLAREIGVTRQTVLAIEKGRLNPSIHIALRTARVLREPVDYVFFLDYSQVQLGVVEDSKAVNLAENATEIWDLSKTQPSESKSES